MVTTRKRRRLLDAYRFPGFVPRNEVRGIFGDPLARDILLVRRSKKLYARTAGESIQVGTTGQRDGHATCRLPIHGFTWNSRCGACRFAHAETVRLDGTLTRLFGWTKAAGCRAIVRLFERFDMTRNEAVQEAVYRWFFDKVSTLRRITLDMDSTVITRHGAQEGATRGC